MKKMLLTVALAVTLPLATSAQSTYENIETENTLRQDTCVAELEAMNKMTAEDKAYRESFLKDLENTGNKINENAAQWAQEKAKRGYPKKKTVKAKAALVDHYIDLLNIQLNDKRLNRFIDRKKVQDKIDYWRNYRQNLNKLM